MEMSAVKNVLSLKVHKGVTVPPPPKKNNGIDTPNSHMNLKPDIYFLLKKNIALGYAFGQNVQGVMFVSMKVSNLGILAMKFRWRNLEVVDS